MKKPKITEGEWKYENRKKIYCGKSAIGLVQSVYSETEERQANAKAISAVPEMIDALIACYRQLENLNNPNGFEPTDITIEMEMAKKALKKAGCYE